MLANLRFGKNGFILAGNSNPHRAMAALFVSLASGTGSSLFYHIFLPVFLQARRENDSREENCVKEICFKKSTSLRLLVFVLLPVTLYCRQYFTNGLLSGLLGLIKSILFSSTFIGSWFLMALIIALVIVFYSSRFLSDKVLLCVAIAVFICVTFRSSYWGYVPESSHIYHAVQIYEKIFTEPFKSFPIAFFWVTVGKLFADNRSVKCIPRMYVWIMVLASSVLLFMEWRFVGQIWGELQNDSYFMLALFCPSVFLLFIQNEDWKVSIDTRVLRKVSIIVYTSHSSIATIISGITNRFFGINAYNYSAVLTVAVATLSIVLAQALIVLSKKRTFKILRYAY